MGVYSDTWNELSGFIPNLSSLLAQKHVQRGWREIRDSRRWSWLVKEDVLFAPALVNTGTVAVSQHSNTVTADSTAAAVLNALGSNPAITDRQFRIGDGPIYNISQYSSPTITLDRPYREASNSAASYQVYRCYYEPPASDFLVWQSIKDMTDGRYFPRRWLHMTHAELDRRDPQRTSKENPFAMASHKRTSTGEVLFEMWPHPTAERAYMTFFSVVGADLTDNDSLPTGITQSLLLSASLRHGYVWAAANQGRHPELQGIDWRLLRRDEEAIFRAGLREAQLIDDGFFYAGYVEDQGVDVDERGIDLRGDSAIVRL